MIKLTATATDLPAVAQGLRLLTGAIQWEPQLRPRFFRRDALVPSYKLFEQVKGQVSIEEGNVSWSPNVVSVFSLDAIDADRWQAFWKHAQRMHPSQIHEHVSAVDLLRCTLQELSKQLSLKDDIRSFGFCVNYPKMLTTTVDRRRGELCGLHFDSWESSTLAQRRCARKRLAANLGPGPRWFLFSPYTCEELADQFGVCLSEDADPTQRIVEAIRQDREALRCVALQLNPGQAYLANTDYLLHDATSYWGTEVNYSAHYLVEPQAL